MKAGAEMIENFEVTGADGQAAAAGMVPEGLELYQDHFPGFPVLPGVLALDLLAGTVLRHLKKQSPQNRYALAGAEAVRFSAWLRPGDRWQSEAVFVKEEAGRQAWKGKILKDGRAAVSARLYIQQLK